MRALRYGSEGGLSFLSLLCLTLLLLKAFGVISISWWWVFAPIWLPLALMIVILLVILGLFARYYREHDSF